MKIGILTHHWVFNYGANLQTLSTVSFLKKQGHIPYVINWVQEDAEGYYIKTTKPELANMFLEFQKQYYPLTDLCRDAKDIASVIKKYGIEMVVIGSDTVWMLQPKLFNFREWKFVEPSSENCFPNAFWGEFLDYGINIPVVAYSAATLDINLTAFRSQRDEIGRYLKRFKCISTRDKYTSDMVSYFTRGEIVPSITPDPVFSFNNNFVQNLNKEEFLEELDLPHNYLLASFSEEYKDKAKEWVNELDSLSCKNGFQLVELPRQTGNRLFDIHQVEKVLNPLEWYNLIRYSKGFIGQLMHPIVISIHNAVPFFCLDHYGTRRLHYSYVDKKTSKAYQIVKQVGKTNQYRNIGGRFGRFPNVSLVMESILTNINKPDLEITQMMNKKSDEAMASIITAISKIK